MSCNLVNIQVQHFLNFLITVHYLELNIKGLSTQDLTLTGFDNTADMCYHSFNLLPVDMLRSLLRNSIKQTLNVEAAKTNLNRTFPDVKLNWKWIQFAQIQVVRWLLRIEAWIDTVLCNKERWPITCKSVDSFTGLMAAIWRADLRAESQGSWSCIEIYTSRPKACLPPAFCLFLPILLCFAESRSAMLLFPHVFINSI